MFCMLAETVSVSGANALLIGTIVALANIVAKLSMELIGIFRKVRPVPPQPVPVCALQSSASALAGCSACQKFVESMHEVVTRTDSNGAPLVYGSREQVRELADRVYDTVTELRAVCRSNDRLVASIDKLVGNREGD